jgi:endonuclease I
VDLQPDKSLRSLHIGHRCAPAELIAEDFRITELRNAEPAWTTARATDLDAASVEDAVEQTLPYHREHVVPQSWFGKKEPMRGDLHHLFACEAWCNSFRGNTPCTEVRGLPKRGEGGAHRLWEERTERFRTGPRQGCRGPRRALLPLALSDREISHTELPADRLQMLLGWHDQDPASD